MRLKTKIMKLGRANLYKAAAIFANDKRKYQQDKAGSNNIKGINDTINKFENEKVNKTISAKNVFLFKTLFALNNFIVIPAISQIVALKNAGIDENTLQNKKGNCKQCSTTNYKIYYPRYFIKWSKIRY